MYLSEQNFNYPVGFSKEMLVFSIFPLTSSLFYGLSLNQNTAGHPMTRRTVPRKNARVSRLTLKDIAREAGVSPTTVSLVLEGKKTSRVSDRTRKRVLEVIDRLNYKPNVIARSLVKKESHSIGLIITTLLNPFYAEIAQDIIDRAKETGYGVVACSVRGGIEDEQRSVEDLISRGVDGLIICSSLRHDPVVFKLAEDRFPFVLTLRSVEHNPGSPPVDSIVVDNKRGGFMATEHLIKMGHKDIALIAGPQETSTGYERLAGALAAFEAYGLEHNPDLILYGDFHRNSGLHLTRQLLEKKPVPTAIFAANDHMAMGVLDALRERGVQVPNEMAVVGFDDIEMSGLPGIDLTTVSQKKATLGRLAVDRLLEKIREGEGSVVKRVILDPILVIRRSCGFQDREETYEIEGANSGPVQERHDHEKKSI